jgi:hypothetical protein
MDDEKARTIGFASGVNLVVGIWLLFAAFAFNGTAASAWNDVIVGALIVLLAKWNSADPEAHWTNWTNVSLGVWLLIAPIALQYPVMAHRWNDVIMGAIAITFGSWSALTHASEPPTRMPQ